MPLTGLEPTIAMALAATVVKRKLTIATTSRPISACHTLFTTPPKAKKAKMHNKAMTTPKTMVFMGRSSSVRRGFCACVPGRRLNSETASEAAPLITPKLFTMPMIPAVAIPPIPI